jgi:probable addiction module antidote protein
MTTATQYAPMDISSHLDNEEVIAEYLTAAAEDENPDVLLKALADVAKARGMAEVAKAAGLGRESLYKALAPGSHPRFETIAAVLRALNVRIAVQPPGPLPISIQAFKPIEPAKREASSIHRSKPRGKTTAASTRKPAKGAAK